MDNASIPPFPSPSVIKQFWQWTYRLRHLWPFSSFGNGRAQTQPSKRAASNAGHVSADPSKITYSVSRAEAVETLNKTLSHPLKVRDTSKSKRYSRRRLYQSKSGLPLDELQVLDGLLHSPPTHEIDALADAASLCGCQGRLEEAERLHRQVIALRRQRLTPQNPNSQNPDSQNPESQQPKPPRGPSRIDLNIAANIDTKTALTGQVSDQNPTDPDRIDPDLSKQDLAFLAELTASPRDAYNKFVLSLEDFAAFLHQQQRYGETLPLLEEAIEVRQQQQLMDFPDVANAFHQLATAYYQQALYSKAEPVYLHALSLFYQQLGPQHSLTQSLHSDFMHMILAAIETGHFTELTTEIPPLDLDHLSELYDWAKPAWEKNLG